jgi:molecular chaperone DnaK
VTAINSSIEELNTVFQAASQEMYNAQQQSSNEQQTPPKSDGSGDQEVTDVDFEEVK